MVQGREKINLVYLFTKMGFSILVSDVDTVWMRNPLPYMAQYPEADVLTSSDHLVRSNETNQTTNLRRFRADSQSSCSLLSSPGTLR